VRIFDMVILSLGCVLLIPTSGLCEQSILSTDGDGEVRFMPDTAHVQMIVEARGPDTAAATAEASGIRQEMVESLDAIGYREDDVKTLHFTVRGELDTRFDDNEIIEIVYVARYIVTVTVEDFATIGAVIDASLSAGATGLNRINYASSRASEYRYEALTQAVEDARRKAEIMARTAGGSLGVLIEMETRQMHVTAAPDSDPGRHEDAPASVVIDPQELVAKARVSAKWEYLPLKK